VKKREKMPTTSSDRWTEDEERRLQQFALVATPAFEIAARACRVGREDEMSPARYICPDPSTDGSRGT
jgi:hypothetical protein